MGITKESLMNQLHAMGIKPGDVILVHSSMKAIGTTLSPEAVLEALYAAVCPGGTLLLPALSYESVSPEHPVFDSKTTEPCIGLLPRTFYKIPGVLRSVHPTHSVCALGARAGELTAGQEQDVTPVGPNSPYMRLPQVGGKLLFIGEVLHACTFMHGVEERFGTDYVLTKEKLRYVVNGEEQYKYCHDFNGWEQDYKRILNVLPERDVTRGMFGRAPCYLIDAASLLKHATEALKKDQHCFVYPTVPEH